MTCIERVNRAIGLLGVALVMILHPGPADAAFLASANGKVVCGTVTSYDNGGPGSAFATGTTGEVTGGGCTGFGLADSLAQVSKGVLLAKGDTNGDFVASASATINETIHLFGPTNATQVTDTYDMAIHGTTTGRFNDASTSEWNACIVAFSGGATFTTPDCLTKHEGTGGEFNLHEVLALSIPAVHGQATLQVQFSLLAEGFGTLDDFGDPVPGTADLENTALITQTLPEGWTFTSDSGVFLTESPSGPPPVPGPASIVLLACAVAGLVSLRGGQSIRKHSQAHRS